MAEFKEGICILSSKEAQQHLLNITWTESSITSPQEEALDAKHALDCVLIALVFYFLFVF